MANNFIPSHGGQLREISERFQIPEESLLDFSASISPIPPPSALIEVLCGSLRNGNVLTRYPDAEYRDLKCAIARYAGVDPGSVCVANGVMPLLDAAVRAFGIRRCLVLVPAFGEYRKVLNACGVESRMLALRERENFLVDSDDVLREVKSLAADSVLLANPHSPSGCLTSASALVALQSALSTLGVTTIVDEAFIDYCPQSSLSFLAAGSGHTIVLRSLTKFFAMPGMRIAYAVSFPENRIKMESILPVWPVDSLAASVAKLALSDATLVQTRQEANTCERQWLLEQMISLGLHVFPSSANYLLLKLPKEEDGFEIWRRLIGEHRIVIRNCASFERLSGQYLRIAVRDRLANRALVKALSFVSAAIS